MNPICSSAFREKTESSPAKISLADAAASHSTKRSGRLHTVAFVDDEEWDRMRVSQILAKTGKFHAVSLYASAEEALLREIPHGQSQVVLMDVRMPKMSGLEGARQLKNLRPDLVIIMISGFEQPDMPGQALEVGADAYLTKPLSVGQFLEALTDCLRRRSLEAAAIHAPHTVPLIQQASFIDKPSVRMAIQRMIMRMEQNFHAREDLLQEALVYFWSVERQHPDRGLGWYLQGVKFHLQHLRASGRSLDSPKRREAHAALGDNCDRSNESPDTSELGDDIMSEISAHDTRSALTDLLEPIDETILVALEEGCASREVAKRLHSSHESIRRHRFKIAAAALKLGIVPLKLSPDHRSHLL